MRELSRLTVTALRGLAKKRGLRGYSRLRKAELITALSTAPSETVAAPPSKSTQSAPTKPAPTKPEPAKSAPRLQKSVVAKSVAAASSAEVDKPATQATPEHSSVSVASPAEPRENNAPVLPTSYGEDRVVLLCRDPEWLFCYWELKPETVRQAKTEISAPIPVLRVLHRPVADKDTRSYFERVDLGARRHYLRLPVPDSVYRVELGFRGTDSRFVAALSSNEVTAPPRGLSDEAEELYATLPVDVPLDDLRPEELTVLPSESGLPPASLRGGLTDIVPPGASPNASPGASGFDEAQSHPSSPRRPA